MNATSPKEHDCRALVLAPWGRDTQLAMDLLRQASVTSYPVVDVDELCLELEQGAGLAIVTEEALLTGNLQRLSSWIHEQPPWSDFPFLVLSQRGGLERNPKALGLMEVLGNVSYVERPFHVLTFISVVRSALRARSRQYEARAQLNKLADTAAALRESEERLATKITERTAELAASEARFRAIFDTAFQCVVLLATDGSVIVANRASLDMIEAQLVEVVGQRFWETAWWAGTAGESRRVQQSVAAAASGMFVRYETELKMPDGSTRTYDFSFKPVRDPAADVGQVIVEGRDVTEARDAELRLRQAQKMEAVGQLTGGIAHDFNNLLTALMGNIDLIKRRSREENVQRLAGYAFEAVQRGAKLTAQLLAFSRSRQLDLRPVDVSALLREMSDLLARSVGPQVQIAVHSATNTIRAIADRNQLELAILNLAINSRDAMEGVGQLDIRVNAMELADDELPDGPYAVISVRDTGCGIAPDVLTRVFEPFFTTKPVGKGTGLGLSQVYGIARQSGGSVRIDTRVDGGTTVHIILPVAEAASEDESLAPQYPAATAAGRSETVMIVDDDPQVRRFVAACLEELGYVVIEAEHGKAALEGVERLAPDLLIADFAMPGLTGAEVASAVRERHPEMPVIIATGYGDPSAIEKVAGQSTILRKPFDVSELAGAVRNALHGTSSPAVTSSIR